MAGTRTARGTRRPRRPRDGLTAPYITLVAVGLISAAVILVAVAQLVQGTAPWQHVSARARIEGVYSYDAATGRVTSGPEDRFREGRAFAARVDWSSLPSRLSRLQVGARWYDDSGVDWGGIQPGTPSQLAHGGFSLVPMVRTDAPPGTYTLDVMRYSAGRPAQILGQMAVKVDP